MATKKTATKPKVAPAKAKGGLFDAIEPLPDPQRPLPAWAAGERAAQLIALGYPELLVVGEGDFVGDDAALQKQMSATRIVPRNALERTYKVYARDTAAKVKLPAAVKHLVERSGNHFALFALEALFGVSETATAVVDALTAVPTKKWASKLDAFGGQAIKGLAFLLWRLPSTERETLRARLEQLSSEHRGDARPAKALDVILHGRAGVERSGSGNLGELHLTDLRHVDDDPAWVAKLVVARLQTLRPADRAIFDLQVGVAGGPKAIAALKAGTAKFPSDQKKSIAAQLSLVG
jgi:hypothetical protein